MKTVKLSISAGAVLVVAAAYFFGQGRLLFLTAFAAAVHELGHFAALRLQGGKLEEVRFGLAGAVMRGSGYISYPAEIITAAAGPAASALLALLSAYAARFFDFYPAYRLAGMSLLFCVFNLIPIMPLDGGRILQNAAYYLMQPRAAEKAVWLTGCAVSFLCLCAGVYVLIVTKTNFTLLAAALWLLAGFIKEGLRTG